MRTPPYDNGKIKMGIYYEPPRYVEQDPDMLEIQKWLIGDPIRLRQEYYIGIAMNVFIGFICLVVVLMGFHEDARVALILGPCLLGVYLAMFYIIGLHRKTTAQRLFNS